MDIQSLVDAFVMLVKNSKIEVYNEFSLQHELGLFIRNNCPSYTVQFERNVSYFSIQASACIKREIDICVYFKTPFSLVHAIELKFPRNGQYPEQMFSFCKDVVFIEQLKQNGFQNTSLLIFADDHNFYQGDGKGIYRYFRSGAALNGTVVKPTGRKNESIHIQGSYCVQWHSIRGKLKYCLIQA